MSKEYITIKFTRNQQQYFVHLLDSMYEYCDKDCYPMYYGYLENALQSIINGEALTLEKEV